ncbi:MAG: hypothetical protein ABS79_04245 [Planctomycetes bacterium SCN 63-9]|nr:MAG: hypothetical protein ABS79_04245 [Planctomycetes bacterium SCN 63-9]
MIGASVALASLWIGFGPETWDFDPSEVRAVPRVRASWHAVNRSDRASEPPPAITPRSRGWKTEEPDGRRASFESSSGRPDHDADASRDLQIHDLEPGSSPVESRHDDADAEQAEFRVQRRNWPPEIASAFERLEMAQRAAMMGLPIEAWRFDTVRAGYEEMLKTHRDNSSLHEEIRVRLASLSRLERGADAARKVDQILERSHQRDRALAQVASSLASEQRAQARAFHAIGMIQPSSKRNQGRKLYTLIGPNGSRRAYLDIPPGVEVENLISHRVGVRGAVNYDETLGSRLITVRDIEELSVQE